MKLEDIPRREEILILTEAHQRLEPLITESEKDVERLRPAYERIYRRCEKIPISPDTFPARFDH